MLNLSWKKKVFFWIDLNGWYHTTSVMLYSQINISFFFPPPVMTQKNCINLLFPQASTKWWVASCLRLVTAMESKAWRWLSIALRWQNWHLGPPAGSPLMSGRASSRTGQRLWKPWGIKHSSGVLKWPFLKYKCAGGKEEMQNDLKILS